MGNLKIIGSSPIEIDYKRQLRAEQWARFCGRHSCAELIEKWSRTRNLDKECHATNKDLDISDSVVGRARANSAVQPMSKVNIAPIKSDRGKKRLAFFKIFSTMKNYTSVSLLFYDTSLSLLFS